MRKPDLGVSDQVRHKPDSQPLKISRALIYIAKPKGLISCAVIAVAELSLYFRICKKQVYCSPELKAQRLAYRIGLEPVSIRVCIRPFTLSNINISETSGRIAIKFYLKHHLGVGKAAYGFWPDRIKSLVPMARGSSHRVIMGKLVLPLLLGCF